MSTPTSLPVGATAIADRATGNELKPNADGSLNVNATAGAIPDTVATGNLTAAQSTAGTPVAGGTVSITLGQGQAVVEAQLTGTFSSGTTVLFEGTDDVGVTTNWFTTFGKDTTVANAPNISSVAGPGPYLVRIPSAGYEQIRVRASALNGGDNVAVRLIGSVAGTGFGSLATNDGSFAKETGGNLASLVTNTTGIATAANQSTANTSLSSIVTNTNKIPASPAQEGGNLATLAGIVSSSKAAVKAASGDFADGAIATIGAQADTAATSDTGTFSLIALIKRLLQGITTGNTNTSNTATNTSTVAGAVSSSKMATKAASGDFADGAINTLGAQADAAYTDATGATSGTSQGLFKGMFVKLAAIATSVAGVLQVKRSTVAVYSLASTATTSSSNSGDLTVGPYTEISIDINTTAQTGTNPTIQFFYKRKAADGLYYTLWQSAVLTAAANTLSTSIGAGMAYNQSLGATGQLTWTIGGTATPGYTFSANIQGK